MPPKTAKKGNTKCQVCQEAESKYRCSACPVRYCSVACYKKHKETDCTGTTRSQSDATAPLLDVPEGQIAADGTTATEESEEKAGGEAGANEKPLKPLTEISWPPEPDSSVFTDPLKRDDPKPLRREELMRIATSPDLRQLLASPTLPRILRLLDSLTTPNARSSCLARLLGVDEISLSKPGQETLLSQRDSPPPLEDLLRAFSGNAEADRRPVDDEGWWLGREGDRIWIGEEEKRMMRVWAGVVVQAIDGDGQGDEWGQGELSWDI